MTELEKIINASTSTSTDINAEKLSAKRERKAKIKQTLSELKRKVEHYQNLMTRAERDQRALVLEHNRLDREIFNATHKTAVITRRKPANMPKGSFFGKKPKQQSYRPKYERFSMTERQAILTRLLEIQALQDKKHTAENSN